MLTPLLLVVENYRQRKLQGPYVSDERSSESVVNTIWGAIPVSLIAICAVPDLRLQDFVSSSIPTAFFLAVYMALLPQGLGDGGFLPSLTAEEPSAPMYLYHRA